MFGIGTGAKASVPDDAETGTGRNARFLPDHLVREISTQRLVMLDMGRRCNAVFGKTVVLSPMPLTRNFFDFAIMLRFFLWSHLYEVISRFKIYLPEFFFR